MIVVPLTLYFTRFPLLELPRSAKQIVLSDIPTEEGFDSLEFYYSKNCTHVDFSELTKSFFLEWAKQTRFLDFFNVEDYSLIPSARFSLFNQFRKIIQTIHMLSCIVEKEKPATIRAVGMDAGTRALLEQIASKKGCLFEFTDTLEKRPRNLCEKLRTPGAIHRNILSLFHRFWTQGFLTQLVWFMAEWIGFLKLTAHNLFKIQPEILFLTSNSGWQRVWDGNRLHFVELHLGKFIENSKSQKSLTFCMIDCPETAIQAMMTQPLSTIPWNGVERFLKIFKKFQYKLNENLRDQLEKDLQAHFKEGAFTFDGIQFPKTLTLQLVNSIKTFAVTYHRRLKVFEYLLEFLTPNKIVARDELAAWYPATIVARLKNIPLIGVSNAAVFPYRLELFYGPGEAKSRVALPNTLAVWGQAEKNMVCEEGGLFLPEKVQVMGSPKPIPRIDFETYRRVWTRKLSIAPTLPIVLLTSNNRHHSLAQKFLHAWEPIKDQYGLIIKLHPRELNLREYNYWAWHFKIRQITVTRDPDLLTLLKISNFHLSYSSTTILEAAWMGIPTLLFDDSLKQDPYGATHEGIAYQLSDFDSLSEALLEVKRRTPDFKTRQREFAKNWFTPDQDDLKQLGLLPPKKDTSHQYRIGLPITP